MIDCTGVAHNSAPDLENNKNCGNTANKRHSNLPMPVFIKHEDSENNQGIYMNTTFKAEEKLFCQNSQQSDANKSVSMKELATSSHPTPKKDPQVKNISIGLYLSPPSRAQTEDPTPDLAFYDALDSFQTTVDNDVECLYEGIDDVNVDTTGLYEGLQSNEDAKVHEAFYEGLDFAEEDSDNEILYEGIPDVLNNDNGNDGEKIARDEKCDDVKQLLESMQIPDQPYQPPKPPPIPYRKKYDPLPDVPSASLDALLSPRLSPIPKTPIPTSSKGIGNDFDSYSDDGFYDGIDMNEEVTYKRTRSPSLVKVKVS